MAFGELLQGPRFVTGYLNDFITADPLDSPQCAQNFISSLQAFGLTSSSWQVRGGTPLLTVHLLGIELDSLAQVARLPAEKLQVPRDLILKWCYRRELESLIGHLHRAA